ncbi:MAG: response regulator transcription factor [Bacteroidota bacterium]
MNDVIRIIIADDHALFLDGLKRILSETELFNFDIVGTATSGHEVVRMVKLNKPHIVFLDLNMPGKDGVVVLEEIRAWNKEIKVVVVTMYDKGKIVKSAIKAGCKGYILKMYGQQELFAAVESILSGETYIGKGIDFNSQGVSTKEDVRFDDSFIRKYKLTKRELEILRLISQALSNKQIGKELFISDQTVSVHRKNIMRKLGVSNTAGLIKVAYDNSLI